MGLSLEDLISASAPSRLRVQELKEQLDELGLPSNGTKAELMQRLIEHFQGEEAKEQNVEQEDTNETNNEDQNEEYHVTENDEDREAENEDDNDAENEDHEPENEVEETDEVETGSKRPADDDDSDGSSKRPRQETSDDEVFAVWLRGLPWETTKPQIIEFLGEEIQVKKVTLKPGNSGEAFVQLASEDCLKATLKKDRATMGRRYVEVFQLATEDYKRQLAQCGYTSEASMADAEFEGVIRMRGLPWSAKVADLKEFFEDYEIEEDGIHLITNREGRASGEAYVVFKTVEAAKNAMGKDKEKIGGRWIDLFQATKAEVYAYLNSSKKHSDTEKPDTSGPSRMADESLSNVVKLRGIPFETTKSEIKDFFADCNVQLASIFIVKRPDGRVAGDAFALFETEEEAREAAKLDKQKLGNRWVELFVVTKAELYQKVGVAVNMSCKPDANMQDVLRMRGLPFQAGVKEVREFFEGYEIPQHRIAIVAALEGNRPPGEAYVQFSSVESAEDALKKKQRETISGRYIELFHATRGDLYAATAFSPVLSMQGLNANYDVKGMTCAKVKGLPKEVDENMVYNFFEGVNVIGIFICRDNDKTATGEGYCEYGSADDCQEAMCRNKELIGDKCLELTPCTKEYVLKMISGPPADIRPAYPSYQPMLPSYQPMMAYSPAMAMGAQMGYQAMPMAAAQMGYMHQARFPVSYGYAAGFSAGPMRGRGRGPVRGRGGYSGY